MLSYHHKTFTSDKTESIYKKYSTNVSYVGSPITDVFKPIHVNANSKMSCLLKPLLKKANIKLNI